jgi:ribosome-associated translation inhibitor RaiA
MRVELRVRNADLADALRGYIEWRLGLSFGWFGDQVGRVRVKVSGLNGPRGGTKKSCRISADLKPFGRVAVHETDLDLHAAIDHAASRVGRLLGQRLEKEKESTFGSEAGARLEVGKPEVKGGKECCDPTRSSAN